MGPVRHKQFIQVLAFVVAIDMAIGVVAVYARSDRAATVTATAPLSQSGTAPAGLASANGGAGGGILAGAQFRNRRRSATVAEGATAGAGNGATGAAASESSGTSASSAAPTTSGSAGPRATSTGSSGRATPAGSGRPTTTAARPAPSGATGAGAAGTVTTVAPDTGFTGAPPVGEDSADPVQPGGGSTGGGSTGGGSTGGGSSGGGSTGTTATTATTRPSGPKTPQLRIPDRTGDTVLEGTTTPASQPRADLVESQANYSVNALLLTAKTVDTVQPKDDPRWISESTFVSWELDTNRDGAVDYEVQFFFAEGTLVAGVSRPGDNESQSACAAEAGQTADGYTVGVDPGCIGDPGSFAYRVTTYYDRDPANENAADVVIDVAPDGGWSQPVSRP